MIKALKYIFVGSIFGVLLTKGEVISWYRIYEMFHFKAFHMYGVIGSAVGVGALGVFLMKRIKIKDIQGEKILFPPKEKGFTRYLIGGIIFGLGWAMTGACPGPLFVLLGNGFMVFGVVILSAMLGTFVYGVIKNKLPH